MAGLLEGGVERAGDIEEKDGVRDVCGQQFIPVEGDLLGGVDRITEGDVALRQRAAGDQREGQEGGLFNVGIVRPLP